MEKKLDTRLKDSNLILYNYLQAVGSHVVSHGSANVSSHSYRSASNSHERKNATEKLNLYGKVFGEVFLTFSLNRVYLAPVRKSSPTTVTI